DGLQDEDVSLATAAKVELIERALAAGARRIEATSFVNPKRVPQMADAEAVMAALPPPGSRDGVSYIGLALNERGVQRAIDARVDEVNFVVITTETFNQRNQGAATFESVAAFESMAGEVRDAGLKCSVTIGASFGCPFEGEVPVARLRSVVDAVAAA